MGAILEALLKALVPQLEAAAIAEVPNLLGKLGAAIGGIFSGSHPAGSSTPTIPPSQPQVPTSAAPVPAPVASAPVHTSWVPGPIKILGATHVGGDHDGQPVSQPYGSDTHLHLDHNLLNPLPWPDKLQNSDGSEVYVDYLFDGTSRDGDPVSQGSVDADGYASRFNIHTLPDTKSHKLELSLVLNGQHGPWLLLMVQQHQLADDGQYHAGYWKKEGKGLQGWVFYNAKHKELYKPGDPGFGCGATRPKEDSPIGTVEVCAP